MGSALLGDFLLRISRIVIEVVVAICILHFETHFCNCNVCGLVGKVRRLVGFGSVGLVFLVIIFAALRFAVWIIVSGYLSVRKVFSMYPYREKCIF